MKRRADKGRFAGFASETVDRDNDEFKSLYLAGVAAEIVRDDETAAALDAGKQLQVHPVLGTLVDRFDVRLLIDDALALAPSRSGPRRSKAEQAEEAEAEQERYADYDPSREHELLDPIAQLWNRGEHSRLVPRHCEGSSPVAPALHEQPFSLPSALTVIP